MVVLDVAEVAAPVTIGNTGITVPVVEVDAVHLDVAEDQHMCTTPVEHLLKAVVKILGYD